MIRVYDGVERGPGYKKLPPAASDGSDPSLDGCLLEIVSQLAGEPWTDRPTCVHPTLLAIARAVNDLSTDAGRMALRPLAPQLVGTARPGFEASARLVAVCVSTALVSPDPQRITADEIGRLDAARQTALHLLVGRNAGASTGVTPADDEPRLRGAARWWLPIFGLVRLSEPFYRCFVAGEQAAEAVAVTARASGTARDLRLRQLLTFCIAVSPASGSINGPRGEGHEATRHRRES